VRPAMVFLENVPGILRWFQPIGEELCRLGYEIEGGLFAASEIGAPHKRQRFFCLAYRISTGLEERGCKSRGLNPQRQATERDSGTLGHSARQPDNRGGDTGAGGRCESSDSSKLVADTEHAERRALYEQRGRAESGQYQEGQEASRTKDGDPIFPPGPTEHEQWRDLLVRQPILRPGLSQAEAESLLRGEVNGLPAGLDCRADRLRALGNAVVPKQAAFALRSLLQKINP
jgi:DNA (cytosine-5)-methyltransferase 1